MARLAGKAKISLNELSQTINLKNRLGRKPTVEELTTFAETAIERINERTLDGETVSGGSFTPYSEEYAEKKGVSRNSVDLFLEGDMLESLAYKIDERKGTVKIMLEGREVETLKGYNHHVGDTVPRRPWFGVNTDEVNSIVAQFQDEAEEARAEERRVTLRDLEQAVSILGFEGE